MFLPHLLAAPVAAPAAPALALPVLAGLTLVAFLAWLVARGLLASFTHTIGYMLLWLAHELKFSVSYGFGHLDLDLGGPFRAANNAVVSALQAFVSESDHLMGAFWHATATLAEWIVAELETLGQETAQTLEWLAHAHVPKWVRVTIERTLPGYALAKLVKAAVDRAFPNLRDLVESKLKELEGKIARDIGRTIAWTIPGVAALPWVIPEVRSLWKWLHAHQVRISRLEKLLTASGLAIALANVLGLPNWRCLTRGNIGKVARHLCGLSPALLNDLLGLLADLLLLANACQVITLLSDAAGFIEPEITAFITAAETFACYGDHEAPPQLPAVVLSLPPVTGVVLSLA